jgi:hypothetical protein
MLVLRSLSRILGTVLICFLVVLPLLAIDSGTTKDFFLFFRGYSLGHHFQANLNEISGVSWPILSLFLGTEFWLLFPVKSQRGHEMKTENLGPFVAKFGFWPGIKWFQIFQR